MGGRPAVMPRADGHGRGDEVFEREGVEDRLQAGREREGVGHPESMLDSEWCRKMVSTYRPIADASAEAMVLPWRSPQWPIWLMVS